MQWIDKCKGPGRLEKGIQDKTTVLKALHYVDLHGGGDLSEGRHVTDDLIGIHSEFLELTEQFLELTDYSPSPIWQG